MFELSAASRTAHLAAMADGRLDVLVVGGGIAGAGVALDACSRGLSVGLVERDDFASGTSGRSSRLIHGGARYLEHAEVGLIYESLRERELLRRLAPHLVRPMAFFVPARRWKHRLRVMAGLTVYDALTLGRGIRAHRRVGPDEGARLAPGLARPSGGFVYYDCRTDDARLTLEVIRRAAGRGALVANHAEVIELLGDGRVTGARVRDNAGGSTVDVHAGMVVNATGAWADRVHALASPSPPTLRPSKGVHLVFDRARVPIRSAVLVPSVAGRNTMVFLIPWGPRVYAGTTDTPYDGQLEEPEVNAEDVEVVLGSVARAFGGELTEADVITSWAGVRPLLDTGKGSTRDLSRRHLVVEGPPGLLTVTGGKLTTFRAMAEQAVDRVCVALGAGGACRTRHIPLGLSRPLLVELGRAATAAERLGLPADAGRRMVARYGDDWVAALELIRAEPGLGEPVVPGLPVLGVELQLARTREMALTDDDVLVRRTRLTTLAGDKAAAAALGP